MSTEAFRKAVESGDYAEASRILGVSRYTRASTSATKKAREILTTENIDLVKSKKPKEGDFSGEYNALEDAISFVTGKPLFPLPPQSEMGRGTGGRKKTRKGKGKGKKSRKTRGRRRA